MRGAPGWPHTKGLSILSKYLSPWTPLRALAFVLVSAPVAMAAQPEGDDLEISADAAAKPKPATAPSAPNAASKEAPSPDLDALRNEVRAMRAELDAIRARPNGAPPPGPRRPAGDAHDSDEQPAPSQGASLGAGLSITGYIQSQLETHQDSEDQLRQGGAPLNQDRFLVRRGRLRLIGEWQYAAAQIELNGDTTRGFAFGIQKAEASLQLRPDPARVPIVQATMGLFDTPFGYELVESPRTRSFMERSQASRAFWPGEPDLGIRLGGGVSFFRWTIAAVNGHPIGDKSFAGQDPTSAKDVLFRFGVDTRPRPDLAIRGSISALRGKGFHAGTDATKATVEWHDLNEDGVVQAYELQALPASSSTPSVTFDHWAVGADLQLEYTSRFGTSKLFGEVLVGQNMDRGLYVADPTLTSVDARELGYYVGFTQEVTPYGLVGLRYDYYDPNADLFDKRAGRLIPFTQTIKTLSPIVGLVLPRRAKLLFQYDVIKDFLARDLVGVPTDLKNNTWTLRLQVEL